jgi:AdoMet-dependent rRNA methyltransferase SPB1
MKNGANQSKAKKSTNTEEAEGENESDGFSSADEADEMQLKKEKRKADRAQDKILGKRSKRKGDEEEDDIGDFFANTEIEVVPQTKIRERTGTAASDDDEDAGYSSMDSEEMAETRALAKVMLRKKARNEIIEGTYNRYAVHEDPSTLPDWFIEDEMRHFRANNLHLVTKD